jgi:hypothetical protein
MSESSLIKDYARKECIVGLMRIETDHGKAVTNLVADASIEAIAIYIKGSIARLPGKARALSIGTGFFVCPLPEVRRAIEDYAGKNHISVKTAAEEALRVYFVEAAAQ